MAQMSPMFKEQTIFGGINKPVTNFLNKEVKRLSLMWQPLFLKNNDSIKRILRARYSDLYRAELLEKLDEP